MRDWIMMWSLLAVALIPAPVMAQERPWEWGWGMHPRWWRWGAGGGPLLLAPVSA
jgi:hypothetical protein